MDPDAPWARRRMVYSVRPARRGVHVHMSHTSRPIPFTVGLAVALLAGCRQAATVPDQGLARPALTAAVVDEDLAFAAQQVRKAENRLEPGAEPRFTTADFAGGQWGTAARTDWRSGFFTGLEWLMFESAAGGDWKTLAEDRTRGFAE